MIKHATKTSVKSAITTCAAGVQSIVLRVRVVRVAIVAICCEEAGAMPSEQGDDRNGTCEHRGAPGSNRLPPERQRGAVTALAAGAAGAARRGLRGPTARHRVAFAVSSRRHRRCSGRQLPAQRRKGETHTVARLGIRHRLREPEALADGLYLQLWRLRQRTWQEVSNSEIDCLLVQVMSIQRVNTQ